MKKLIPSHEIFILDFNAPIYMENFLISSVASILFIRMFLSITGYPHLGGESLHIAHMLWGGLLMFIAMTLTLSFINKEAKRTASYVGGIGFGVFIDELGKFITHDNNYFFRPTFALLYVMFLLLAYGLKKLYDLIQKDEKEYAMNALEILKEAVFYDLDENEKKHILNYLQKADKKNQIIHELTAMMKRLDTIPDVGLGPFAKFKLLIRNNYLKIIRSAKFIKLLMIIFVIGSVNSLIAAITSLYLYNTLDFWDWGLNIAVFMTGIFIVIGLKDFATNRLSAYKNFKKAAMVSILFTQFFTFYHQQLAALIPLLTSFSVYLGIQAILEEEHLT